METISVDERFERASIGERELTPRQREVLDLIVEGKTNRQIGDALGMTLDGAKWNVSEILTKLGMADREDAARYWRWRKRRAPQRAFARAMRALVGLPALKVAAGGAAAVVAGVIAVGGLVALQAADADSEPDRVNEAGNRTDAAGAGSSALQSEMALEIEAQGAERTPYDGIAGSSGNQWSLHAWHAAGGRVRCDETALLQGEPLSETIMSTTVVSDGVEKQLRYSDLHGEEGPQLGRAPMWREATDDTLPECIGATTVPAPPGVDRAGWVAAGRARFGDDLVITIGGEETLLGRRVTVVDLAWESNLIAAGAPEFTEHQARVWFDEALGLVMKEDRRASSGHSSTYEVTRLVVDGPMDPELFLLEQPADATVVPSPEWEPRPETLADGSATELAIVRTPGLYAPSGQPQEWILVHAEASPAPPEYAGGVTFPYSYGFRLGSWEQPGATIWLTQELPDPGLSSAFRDAPVVAVAGAEAPFVTGPDGLTYVTWLVPETGVRATATLWNVTAEEFAALFPLMFGIQP